MPETSVRPIFADDPWLQPFAMKILRRVARTEKTDARLSAGLASLSEFACAHEYFGLHQTEGGWVLRERAPFASRISLIGDSTEWREVPDFEMKRLAQGEWELHIPRDRLRHGQLYKLMMYWNEGGREVCGERLPSHVRRVVQDPVTHIFSAQVWSPENKYTWKNDGFRVPQRAPRIYEAHVGMAQTEGRVGTYSEFTEKILPRIADAGYNVIQLMAIQEHPYYGSFGYQVSNFFAASSRFGTPEELMELVDTAHGLGIAVIMDLVHSHAVKNELEGLSKFDGSTTLYFHSGGKGEHPAWNTRCFDYGKGETLHLLLSNCRYWLDAFHFDGYRFDGVTSMMYWDHGLGKAFGSYTDYYDGNVDVDSLVYLTLANKIIHEVRPDALVIAEDMSGMPGLASPIVKGGIGFDYRLAMGTPDYWIKVIKEQSDENWNVSAIYWELTNRRADEKTIGYAESHDQALVGDKTLIFRLADQEMYWSMRTTDENIVIERAIALHKIIRLLTLATSGNGYLNFMGNEFGHPEWIDFPREGNEWSYQHARRQWNLRDDQNLRYHHLADFDRAMMKLCDETSLLFFDKPHKIYEHISDQVLAFERRNLIFVLNLNGASSFTDRAIPAFGKQYRIVLSTDSPEFGGFGRIEPGTRYHAMQDGSIKVYIPTRTMIVLERVGE